MCLVDSFEEISTDTLLTKRFVSSEADRSLSMVDGRLLSVHFGR